MGESELSKNEKFVSTFSSLLVDTIEEIVKVNSGYAIVTSIPDSGVQIKCKD